METTPSKSTPSTAASPTPGQGTFHGITLDDTTPFCNSAARAIAAAERAEREADDAERKLADLRESIRANSERIIDAGEDDAVAAAKVRKAEREREEATDRKTRDELAMQIEDLRREAAAAKRKLADLSDTLTAAQDAVPVLAGEAQRLRLHARNLRADAEKREEYAVKTEVAAIEDRRARGAALRREREKVEAFRAAREALPHVRCGDCRYWFADTPLTGECRRLPPHTRDAPRGFPTVDESTWCGMAEAIPRAPTDANGPAAEDSAPADAPVAEVVG